MSIEEDWLVRRVRELIEIMKGGDMLEECAQCTTLYAVDLDKCPNCGHAPDEKVDPGEATAVRSLGTKGGRPDMLDSPHGPGATLVGNEASLARTEDDANERREDDPNVTIGNEGPTSGEHGDDNAPDPDAPQETVDGKPGSYQDTNVEQLRAEVKRRKDLFIPSNANKPTIVAALRKHDRDRAARES